MLATRSRQPLSRAKQPIQSSMQITCQKHIYPIKQRHSAILLQQAGQKSKIFRHSTGRTSPRFRRHDDSRPALRQMESGYDVLQLAPASGLRAALLQR